MWNMTAHGSLHLARKAQQVLHSISVGAGHLQDVQHPSRIEGFREFEVDLSALFCKKYYFNKRNERFPYYKQYECRYCLM